MFKHDLSDGADLRILQKFHAPILLQFLQDNRVYLAEWLDWVNRINTDEDAEKFIQRGLDRFAQDGLPWVGIWQDNAMAGGVLFFPVEARTRSTEIGYWLGQHAAGHGLMTRAIAPLLNLAFDRVGINRVGLIADVRNTRSRAVAERVGFAYEGVRRDGWTQNGEYIDVATYSMLAREWRAKRTQSSNHV